MYQLGRQEYDGVVVDNTFALVAPGDGSVDQYSRLCALKQPEESFGHGRNSDSGIRVQETDLSAAVEEPGFAQ